MYVSTSKYTVTCTLKTTKITSETLQLIKIICPSTIVFIHITIKVISWRTAKRVKEFSVISIIAHVDDDPVFSGLSDGY